MTMFFAGAENHKSAFEMIAASVLVVAAAFAITFATMLAIYEFSGIFSLEKTRHVFLLKELQTRAFLLLVGLALTALLIGPKQSRARFLAPRWPLVALGAFWIGFAITLADPFHGIREEGNWVRYATSAILIVTGVLAIASLVNRMFPVLLRLIGAGFGALMIAAALDELFEFHETLVDAAEPAASTGYAALEQDLPTIIAALAGVAVLAMLLVGYRLLQRNLGMAWLSRYSLPLRFFATAVVVFAVAIGLDSVDSVAMAIGQPLAPIYKVAAVPDFAGAAHVLLDLDNTFNSIEEVLEYTTGICFLMMVGSAFSISLLGFGRPAPPSARPTMEPASALR